MHEELEKKYGEILEKIAGVPHAAVSTDAAAMAAAFLTIGAMIDDRLMKIEAAIRLGSK